MKSTASLIVLCLMSLTGIISSARLELFLRSLNTWDQHSPKEQIRKAGMRRLLQRYDKE
jgi:hypothetical protein